MKREFLKNLGIEKEVIHKIMDENGKDINKLAKERDAYKRKFEILQNTFYDFDGVNVEALKNKITTLHTGLIHKDKQCRMKLDDLKFDALLKNVIKEMGVRNEKTVIAFLDIDRLKKSKNPKADIAYALEMIKKENAHLFPNAKTQIVTPKKVNVNTFHKKAMNMQNTLILRIELANSQVYDKTELTVHYE